MPKRSKSPQHTSAVQADGLNVRNFKFGNFDATQEEWEYYEERFEIELRIAGITKNEDKRDLLLSRIGSEAFKVLVDNFRPDKVSTVSFDSIISSLRQYYGQKYSTLGERVAFNKRYRNEDESIMQYLNALKTMAGKCRFGDSLTERLRDQLVLGINNASWQQQLLRTHPEVDCTLQDVLNTAVNMEKADETFGKLNISSSSCQQNNVRDGITKFRKNTKTILVRGRHCLNCGLYKHDVESCPAKGQRCHSCKGQNHYARVCIKSGNVVIKELGRTRNLKENADCEYSDSEGHSSVMAVQNGNKVMLLVEINGRKIDMLFDPGAAKSVVSKKVWEKIGSPKLVATPDLIAYTGVQVRTLGKTNVSVKGFGKTLHLPLTVVEEHDIPLFGLDWVLKFNLPLPQGSRICTLKKLGNTSKTPQNLLQDLKNKYPQVFLPGLGKVKGHKAVIHMSEVGNPKVYKPRPVPFALREGVEAEIRRLVSEGVLETVDSATNPITWAAPIVVIVKPSGKLRICADFKATINKHIYSEHHPMPRFEEITANLQGGEHFSIIDLKDAYLQVAVEEESRKYLVIATHMGYYKYCRLPFGIRLAPALFQKIMDQVLLGIPGVACYLDDILVTGKDFKEHVERLDKVFSALANAGIRVQETKCKLFQKEVVYLGHKIDSLGIHPTLEHIEAIKSMPAPSNVKELRSFLGTLNYYQKFFPNLQINCAPLHRLLKKGTRWKWTETDNSIITKLKNTLTSSDTLVHFDSSLPIIVSSDASELGLGAVISHVLSTGEEKPIAFASRTLSKAETKYSTLDREALGIVFAVRKFHQYLYGRHFILRTDHKPLIRLLGENDELPKMTANRLTRWALILSAYSYKIEYVNGKQNAPADALSRLPLNGTDQAAEIDDKFSTKIRQLRLESVKMSKKDLQRETCKDSELKDILMYLDRGWPDKKNLPKHLEIFYDKRQELSFEDNMLLWKGRIIIPKSLRNTTMQVMHEGHPGIEAMRSSARLYVWWPNINAEVEKFVKKCKPCQKYGSRDPLTPLYSWTVPNEPWTRIHIDFAGPLEGFYWLIVVDATTKWLEVFPLRQATSMKTLSVLKETFARFGHPKIIVSDNGSQFTGGMFKQFCAQNNISHITSAPYHPKTNGLAERAVQTFKRRFAATKGSGDMVERLAQFLMSYRNLPHKTTGRSPAEMMFGRRLNTKLSLLKPDVSKKIQEALVKQKKYYDVGKTSKEFEEGEDVWVVKTAGQKGYDEGVILKKIGARYYLVEIDGRQHRRHVDQMKHRVSS